ncbi:hypothetical protein B0H17DRAFT_844481, partial [Mycena rosella]
DIESTVNLQHDCSSGKCGAHDTAPVMQEREMTRITRPRIWHTNNLRFIVNTSSLHNYRQISKAIPASLEAYSFTVSDQVALRAAASAQIRD